MKALRKLFPQTPEGWSKEVYDALPALKCEIAYNRYGGYCIPASSRHRFACQMILRNDVHEPETLALMRRECGRGDIVHAGTFFGDFLPALSSGLAGNAKLWAFEPSLENYRCARVTRELNGLENVVLTHAGLGSEAAKAKLRTHEEGMGNLGGGSVITADGTEDVEIVRIDDAVEGNVSIIQLDVEGYEKEALQGAIKTIRRCSPLLILEARHRLKPAPLLEDPWIIETILRGGYKVIGHVHENVVLRR